jgi:opacity protein-like surface antigen
MMKQIVLGAVAAAALCGTALAADVYEPVHEPVYTPHVERRSTTGSAAAGICVAMSATPSTT